MFLISFIKAILKKTRLGCVGSVWRARQEIIPLLMTPGYISGAFWYARRNHDKAQVGL